MVVAWKRSSVTRIWTDGQRQFQVRKDVLSVLIFWCLLGYFLLCPRRVFISLIVSVKCRKNSWKYPQWSGQPRSPWHYCSPALVSLYCFSPSKRRFPLLEIHCWPNAAFLQAVKWLSGGTVGAKTLLWRAHIRLCQLHTPVFSFVFARCREQQQCFFISIKYTSQSASQQAAHANLLHV